MQPFAQARDERVSRSQKQLTRLRLTGESIHAQLGLSSPICHPFLAALRYLLTQTIQAPTFLNQFISKGTFNVLFALPKVQRCADGEHLGPILFYAAHLRTRRNPDLIPGGIFRCCGTCEEHTSREEHKQCFHFHSNRSIVKCQSTIETESRTASSQAPSWQLRPNAVLSRAGRTARRYEEPVPVSA